MTPDERAAYDTQVYSRLIRFADLEPTWDLSPNCRLPAHERANYLYVGDGPYLNREQGDSKQHPTPPISGDHYSCVILQCAPGKGAPLHAHTTEELFLALSGSWVVYWGEDAQHELILEPWDAVSFPAPVMRGFRNAGPEDAYLLSVIGGGTPAPPVNHPAVIRQLENAGLSESWTGG